MTSNIGSEAILDFGKRRNAIGFMDEEDRSETANDSNIRQRVMEMLREQFRPEFLNRVDETVVFHSLRKENLAEIVDLQLQYVAKRLLEKKIRVTFTTAAKQLVADKGYDPNYGARPLKRAIQEYILDDLALQIVENKIQEGDGVKIDVKEGKILIKKTTS
jgi:ATP-dependent Clp protease ATP-binding subunit ClpC